MIVPTLSVLAILLGSIALLAARARTEWWSQSRRAARAAERYLDPGEPILETVHGHLDEEPAHRAAQPGVLVATDRRILFLQPRLVGSHLANFPYDKIASVHESPGVLGHMLSFFAPAGRVSVHGIAGGDVPRFLEVIRGGVVAANRVNRPILSSAAGAGRFAR